MLDKNNINIVKDVDLNTGDHNQEYIYLTIPVEYTCVYHKLLVYMADFGKDIVDDCHAACKGSGKNILSCWNLFQSALACYALGKYKESSFFIDYINKQLDLIYGASEIGVYTGVLPSEIDELGRLSTIVSCGDDYTFYVDIETGELFQEFYSEATPDKVYMINDNHLIVSPVEDSQLKKTKCNCI